MHLLIKINIIFNKVNFYFVFYDYIGIRISFPYNSLKKMNFLFIHIKKRPFTGRFLPCFIALL